MKPPLPSSRNRVTVEPGIQTLDDAHLADAAIPKDHDFENDVPLDFPPQSIFGVVRIDAPDHRRRLDAAPEPARATAETAAFAFAHTRSGPRTATGSGTGASAAARPGAGGVGSGHAFLEHTFLVHGVGGCRNERRIDCGAGHLGLGLRKHR